MESDKPPRDPRGQHPGRWKPVSPEAKGPSERGQTTPPCQPPASGGGGLASSRPPRCPPSVPWAVSYPVPLHYRVADEVLRRGATDPVARFLRSCDWLQVEPVANIPTSIQAWDLGAGESATLAYALAHQPTVVVVDDLAGRRCAAALGLPVRGTLGLVLLAKRRGRIESARALLERLRLAGMYLSPQIIEDALRLVGE
ncbi:MAG: DUF3368 domain-containing protein [Candidatus Riflebacteria bacterium]|nr:DUF3368 domain-containing protein [Candidatus Riflebacteria bacterium]